MSNAPDSLPKKIALHMEALNAHRKRVHRYDTESVTLTVSKRLRSIETNFELARQCPHNYLYDILKLSIEGYPRRYGSQRQLSDSDLLKLCRFYEEPHHPQIDIAEAEGDPICMALNWIAVCQFPFQEHVNATDMGRAIELYTRSGFASEIGAHFQNHTGLTCQDYLLGCLILYTQARTRLYISTKPPRLNLSLCSSDRWRTFLAHVALAPEAFAEKLKTAQDVTSALYAHANPPVLQIYPAIQFPSNIVAIPWPMFVAGRVCYGIYDILKASCGNSFTQNFGHTLQSYVERLLNVLSEHEQLAYHPDRELDRTEEQPDFVVVHGLTMMSVEVKAIEDRVYINRNTLIRDAHGTLGKAVNQCAKLWSRCQTKAEPSLSHQTFNLHLVLVVTWKPFFWANNSFYRQALERPEWDSGSKRYQVICIKEFEALVALSLSTHRSICDLVAQKVVTVPCDSWGGFLAKIISESPFQPSIPGITNQFEKLTSELLASVSGT